MIKLGAWEFPPAKKVAAPEGQQPDRHTSEKAAAALAAALAASSPGIAEAQTAPQTTPPRIERVALDAWGQSLEKLRTDFDREYEDGNPASIEASIFDTRFFGPVRAVEDIHDETTNINYRVFEFVQLGTNRQAINVLHLRIGSDGSVDIGSPIGTPYLVMRFTSVSQPNSTPASRFEQAAIVLRRMLTIEPGPGGEDRLYNRP